MGVVGGGGRWMGALFVWSATPPPRCQVGAASAWQMLKHIVGREEKKKRNKSIPKKTRTQV